jgi:hypothetical protein
MREVYCFLTVGESDSKPELSKQAFARTMRSSIARTILSHDEEPALEGLTAFGRTHGELWVAQQRAVQNLAEAEESLEHAAKQVQDLRDQLTGKDVGISVSRGVGLRLNRKRKLEEVEAIIQNASDVCKRLKQEEKMP